MIEKQKVKSDLWCDSSSQLADCLTKVGTSSEKLLHVLKGEDRLINQKKNFMLTLSRYSGSLMTLEHI